MPVELRTTDMHDALCEECFDPVQCCRLLQSPEREEGRGSGGQPQGTVLYNSESPRDL